MTLIKGILKETNLYYQNIEKETRDRIALLPRGSIKKRKINGKIYYYLQYRQKNKIKHKYLGKDYPENTLKQLIERKVLEKQVKEILKKLKVELELLKKLEKRKEDNQ